MFDINFTNNRKVSFEKIRTLPACPNARPNNFVPVNNNTVPIVPIIYAEVIPIVSTALTHLLHLIKYPMNPTKTTSKMLI